MSDREAMLQRYVEALLPDYLRRSIYRHIAIYGDTAGPTAAFHVGLWVFGVARLNDGR